MQIAQLMMIMLLQKFKPVQEGKINKEF